MIVVLMDQKDSRSSPDKVVDWSRQLNDSYAGGMRLPFVRTAGDEMQALLGDPNSALSIVLEAFDSGHWWVGLGLGPVDAIGDTTRDSRGPAFWSARNAIEQAKRRSWRVAVSGSPEWLVESLEGLLAMLTYAHASRTQRAAMLINRAMAGGRQSEIASELMISPQAVSKQLRNAGFQQERLGRAAAIALLGHAAGTR